MDVQSWRAPTKEEIIEYFEKLGSRSKGNKKLKKGSFLAVRQNLSPLDLYCYLKARFGEPNGYQNSLRKDDSDNWIHWDFILKAGDEDVYACGMSREIHFMLSENLKDENWRDFIMGIKSDYKRVAKEKSAVLKSLEQWVTFPNKFVEVANICAELHAEILDNIGGFQVYQTPSYKTKKGLRESEKVFKRLSERSSKLYKHCLELSLLTPVLAEAFLNMVILILCKQDIRSNKRQFDAFIRSQIDTKVFDLFYKCEGFARPIDQRSETFKNFKRVMDKRNHAIHGNCDPEGEIIERVYFEGKRPLYKESGDHIGKFFEALERQHQPNAVIKDYEDTYAFLVDTTAYLKPGYAQDLWRVIEDPYPGYDIGRNITGCLFPNYIATAAALGVRYDAELAVTWS
jgi:hypothetical protein